MKHITITLGRTRMGSPHRGQSDCRVGGRPAQEGYRSDGRQKGPMTFDFLFNAGKDFGGFLVWVVK